MSAPLVTVAIPTLNGEQYLERLLVAVFDQDIDGDLEVLVVDSGSSDRTLEILGKFPQVKVHSIEKKDFGHGKTRNFMAELAQGTYIAYLTQDAIPLTYDWLSQLLSPLRQSDKVLGVFGKQIPRPNCPPLIKYEIYGVFGAAGVETGVTFYSQEWTPAGAENQAAFYSDVNSATRVSTLRNHIPLRDVPYAEDQFFAADILAAGYWKAYSPRAQVEHSNDVTLREYRKRIFDEGLALKSLGQGINPGGIAKRVLRTLRGSFADARRLLKDPGYGRKGKLKWLVLNPLFHWNKWSGYALALKVDSSDESAVAQFSLERERQRLNS